MGIRACPGTTRLAILIVRHLHAIYQPLEFDSRQFSAPRQSSHSFRSGNPGKREHLGR